MITEPVLKFFALNVSNNLRGERRISFLNTLQKNPERVALWVNGNLTAWSTIAVWETNEIVDSYDDNVTESSRVVEYFKQHFASELAAIPA